jgi:hypothetical protein
VICLLITCIVNFIRPTTVGQFEKFLVSHLLGNVKYEFETFYEDIH